MSDAISAKTPFHVAHLSSRMKRTATAVALAVATILPVGYATVKWQGLTESYRDHAQIKAQLLNQLVARNPDFWPVAESAVAYILNQAPAPASGEQIKVFDLPGSLVAKVGVDPVWPSVQVSLPLHDNGQIVGNIVVTGSAAQIMREAGGIALVSAALGGLVLFILSILPLRTLRRVVRALEDEKERAETMLRSISDAVVMVDADGVFVQMNPAGQALLRRAGHAGTIGSKALDAISPEFRGEYVAMHRRVIAGEQIDMKFEIAIPGGERRWLDVRSVPMLDQGETVQLSVLRDITEQIRSDEKLHLAASVFTHAREGIMITRADGMIMDVNTMFTTITGYSKEDVLGKNPRILGSKRHGREFYENMWRSLLAKGHWYGEVWNRRKTGETYVEMLAISVVRDGAGAVSHFVALFSDITNLKDNEKRLETIAHYDPLTQLPNRVLLSDRMKQAMALAVRRKQVLAVAYLDLDGFKEVNDTHGHLVGDRLLIELSERMKEALREADTLARMGGDEFVALLLDLETDADCIPVLDRLREVAATPIDVDGLELKVTASIGASFFPQDENIDADQLLRQADQAMYQAKQTGKNRIHFFDAEHDSNVRGHHETIERIRRALADNEFVLHYQPKVNMKTGAIIGAEALIRWRHPEKGLLGPDMFLPDIAGQQLSVDVGEWVINEALSQIGRWQSEGLHIPVSVNIEARQLQQHGFIDRLRHLLNSHPNVQPDQLELEVLETSALEDLSRVSQVIEACREMGIGFALDDFGTGYSSLSYLKHLPAARLKIDQSFVRDMLEDPDDLAILESILNLATSFNRQVIAEGVETVEHGALLLKLGCEIAQGFGIARPMPPARMRKWVETWKPHKSWLGREPASRDDFPLLFANIEHNAWASSIVDYVQGQADTYHCDTQTCRFGKWLATVSRVQQADFSDIDTLHWQLHNAADEILRQFEQGNKKEATAQVPHFLDLKKNFLSRLERLVRNV